MSEPLKNCLIPSRVIVIGERCIPAEELEKVSDENIQIFLREPNPEEWPPEIAHFKKYLPPKEQLKWSFHQVLEQQEELLNDLFERWMCSVWKDLIDNDLVQQEQSEHLVEEITSYLKTFVENFVTSQKLMVKPTSGVIR